MFEYTTLKNFQDSFKEIRAHITPYLVRFFTLMDRQIVRQTDD